MILSTPTHSFQGRTSVLSAIVAGLRTDLRTTSLRTCVARLFRRFAAIQAGSQIEWMLQLPEYHTHLRSTGQADMLFFLAYRHYILRDLSLRERSHLAFCHHAWLNIVFSKSFIEKLCCGKSILVWACVRSGHSYEIRLSLGLDVMHEGALSLALFSDEHRISIISFSAVPRSILSQGQIGHDYVILAARKQNFRHRNQQGALWNAFDRTPPEDLVVAALEGLVIAVGQNVFFGIRAEAQPTCTPERMLLFKAAYTDYWASIGGVSVSSRAYMMGVPAHETPIESVEPTRRERELARREHTDEVRQSVRKSVACGLSNSTLGP